MNDDFIYSCLNSMQIDEIRRMTLKEAKIEALLRHLQNTCKAQYVMFLQLLRRTGHEFVAKKLQEGEESNQ